MHTQTLIAERVDRIEDENLHSRGFLDHGQEMFGMLPEDRSTLVVPNSRACSAGSHLDHAGWPSGAGKPAERDGRARSRQR